MRRWDVDDFEGFAAKYTRARRLGIDALAERALAVATDKARDPNCRRVEIDTIKWFTSKMRPDKYGDRTVLAGDPTSPLQAHVTVEFVAPIKPGG